MKLTTEKLMQIIKEEVQSIDETFGGNYAGETDRTAAMMQDTEAGQRHLEVSDIILSLAETDLDNLVNAISMLPLNAKQAILSRLGGGMMQEALEYKDVTRMMFGMGYGAVGGITAKKTQSFGQFDYNNGVIGIIEPNSARGDQYYPAGGSGDLGAVIKALKGMGYRNVGMALPASNKDPQSLRRMASHR